MKVPVTARNCNDIFVFSNGEWCYRHELKEDDTRFVRNILYEGQDIYHKYLSEKFINQFHEPL